MDNARQTGPAVEALFLLGDRIQSTALDVLELLLEATCDRKGHLARANLGIATRQRISRFHQTPGSEDQTARAADRGVATLTEPIRPE